mmetsp:Transcript_22865/g.71011  ORF Transcript_22865/g.71011 Transcript_22865/m.71011 type:complete len:214 (-) Transcript_22865:157-798(-)
MFTISRQAALPLLVVAVLVCSRARAGYPIEKERFVTWGFEDFDFPDDDFHLKFPEAVAITRIEGFVSASMLPEHPEHRHSQTYIRQMLLVCHNGTRGPIHGEHAPAPWAQKDFPERTPRWEQSVTMSAVEINIKQHDREVIHLPVNYKFRAGELIVYPEKAFTCHTDIKTYTGEGNRGQYSTNGMSTDPHECLDLEVHFVIHYIPVADIPWLM